MATVQELKKKMEGKQKHLGSLSNGLVEDILPMETKLYNSFGGWNISCDGESIDIDRDDPGEYNWEDLTSLSEIEEQAKKKPNSKWIADYFGALRGATYQRSDCGQWILIETNQGFA